MTCGAVLAVGAVAVFEQVPYGIRAPEYSAKIAVHGGFEVANRVVLKQGGAQLRVFDLLESIAGVPSVSLGTGFAPRATCKPLLGTSLRDRVIFRGGFVELLFTSHSTKPPTEFSPIRVTAPGAGATRRANSGHAVLCVQYE